MAGKSVWTPAMDAALRDMIAKRISASKIGAALGITRNAVIGKAHRLGIAVGRSRTTLVPEARKQARTKPSKPRTLPVGELAFKLRPAPKPAPIPTLRPDGEPPRFLDLTSHECHWHLPRQHGMNGRCCGAPVHGDGPWLCDGHRAKAYVAGSAGRKPSLRVVRPAASTKFLEAAE